MSFSVRTDLSPLKSMVAGDKMRATRRLLASHIMEDCDRYVPVRTGALHDNRLVSDDGTRLEWSVNYARYVYDMPENTNWTKPGSHPQWVEYAKSRHYSEWCDFLQKAICK